MRVVASNQQLNNIAVVFVEDKVPIVSHLISLLSCFKYGNFKALLEQMDVPLPQDPESTKLTVLQLICNKTKRSKLTSWRSNEAE